MLDVILYGGDRVGRLTASEQRFRLFRGLVYFFNSRESRPWEWAEVAQAGADGRIRYVRYPAERLRSMVVTAGWRPSPN